MVRESKRTQIGLRLGFHSSYSNVEVGGKIWVFCKHQSVVTDVAITKQMISLTMAFHQSSNPVTFSIVYVSCSRIHRRTLWEDMAQLFRSVQGPWALGGDFNVIIDTTERCSKRSFDSGSSQEFGQAINNAASMQVHHLPHHNSNHAPMLLVFPAQQYAGSKPFRFQRMWFHHEDFIPLVKDVVGNIFSTIKQAESNLNELEQNLQQDVGQPGEDNAVQAELLEARASLARLEFMEESFCKQKARNSWLVEGDRNTGFFHASVAEKARKALISSIRLDSGQTIESPAEIKLSKLLPSLISLEQGAFVQGRSISENIVLSQDLLRELNRNVRGGNILVKLDMEKAYDKVEWLFLKRVLEHFRFSATWIQLVEL
ncbi:uncharacterized protein LOC131248529 [Magnolia sinica]|uniref:uncharacterized protein LOC131248529 n=1 Tax=Magnolia sinica TaxID=86752 RepID=UPI0026594410|nr:uncharacterized protein LOC131248529 [Magnolia sinica]